MQENSTKLIKPKYGGNAHRGIPHAIGADISNSCMISIDTVTNYDMVHRALVEGRLPGYVRDMIRPTIINIANGNDRPSLGMRAKSAPWDRTTNAGLMDNSPNLNSVDREY